ncbi:MAG: InlB B-repeat-containing protein, partial [Firmicutes bacterium]|nr:InlB B-repeat-containing protein [Bacillota bacterium]MDY5530953.1 InlB B-repeat-containing protein [Pumilibacteraceae bacterium]
VAGDELIMSDSDTVLYAVWEKERYVVTFYAPGGYSLTGLKNSYGYGETVTFQVIGAQPKVYVDGIRKEEDANGSYSFSLTGNAHIFIADGSKISVIYSPNGGADAPTDNTAYNAGATVLISDAEPTRTGYSFHGWSTREHAIDVEYNSGAALDLKSEDVVLYAVWRANEYTVSYDASGGTGDMNATEFSYGTEGALRVNSFEKIGHTFLGWALSADGEVVYGDGVSVSDLCEQNNGNVTLYAVWGQTITEISFRSDDGIEIASPISVAYGKELTSDGLTVPSRTGYIFNGYRTRREGLGELVFDAKLNVAISGAWDKNVRTLTLYPHWTPVSYTVVYIDGQKEVGRSNAVYDKSFTLTSAASLGITAKAGYRFVGWSTAPSGLTISYTDEQNITAPLAQTDGEQVYVYAVFAENQTYSVIYNANGGSNAPVDNNLYFVGDTVFFADMIPEREGYVFCGWSFDPNKKAVDFPYEGYRFTISSVEMREGGLSLYAVWKLEGESPTLQIEAIKAKNETLANEIESLKTADGDLSERLNEFGEELKAAQNAIDSLGDTYATHAELAEEAEKLTNLITAAKTELSGKIESVRSQLQQSIDALTTTVGNNKEDIEKKVKAVEDALAVADSFARSNIASLIAEDEAIRERIKALEESLTKAENDLKAMINGVQKNLDDAVKDLNNTIAGNKTDIEAKLKKVEEEYKAADALMKLDIASLIAKDTELEARIKALEESCSSANAELRAAIDKVQKDLNDANRRLDEKDAELETKLNTLRADSDKNSLICLIVNIVLGIAVLVLLALYIVVATKKKSQK